jgi:hypothetical protein
MRKGWLTPGWSRSWVAAASRPSRRSQEVIVSASCKTQNPPQTPHEEVKLEQTSPGVLVGYTSFGPHILKATALTKTYTSFYKIKHYKK